MRKEVVKIEKACPLCGSDVYGNDDVMYLCRKCWFLYRGEQLRVENR